MCDHDDEFRGHVLTRREALKAFGGAGLAAFLAACGVEPTPTTAAPTGQPATASLCVARPALAEGPFFIDNNLTRSDIRSDPTTGEMVAGVPLLLEFAIYEMQPNTCTPFPEVVVDVWHTDAAGVYSGVQGNDAAFLRGNQTTNAEGVVSFTTIVPGWYPGRTPHIHFKLRSADTEFTSQLYFDEAFIREVYQQPPYATRGQANVGNGRDGLFSPDMLLDATPAEEGYATRFNIGLDTSNPTSGDTPGGPVIQP